MLPDSALNTAIAKASGPQIGLRVADGPKDEAKLDFVSHIGRQRPFLPLT